MSHEVQQQLLVSLHDSPTGFALFDADERLRYANAWFRQAYGLSSEAEPSWEQLMRDCHRRRCGVLIETDDIDAWIARVRMSYRRTPVRSFESDLVDGRWLWVTETLRSDGWLALTATDVSSLKANETTLRKSRDDAVIASLTDPLTELYNRRYIFERLHDLLSASRDMRVPLCLAVMDLDNFKFINDRHGHHTGDCVLAAFARHLSQNLRPLDAVIKGVRFGLSLQPKFLKNFFDQNQSKIHLVYSRLTLILLSKAEASAMRLSLTLINLNRK